MKLIKKTKAELLNFRKNQVLLDDKQLLEGLEPSKVIKNDRVVRWNFFHMTAIIESELGASVTKMEDIFDIPDQVGYRTQFKNQVLSLNFWEDVQYLLMRRPDNQMRIFWTHKKGNCTNRLYIGTDVKKIRRRILREPTEEEMYIQQKFYDEFSHLAKGDWINVEMVWT